MASSHVSHQYPHMSEAIITRLAMYLNIGFLIFIGYFYLSQREPISIHIYLLAGEKAFLKKAHSV